MGRMCGRSLRCRQAWSGWSPRWSFDDAWLAFHGRGSAVWDERLYLAPSQGGESRPIARAAFMRGVSWLPDGRGLVYSSSAGSTLPYPPTFNLRVVDIDGADDQQITYGDVSFVEPDVHQSGRLVVCRIRGQSDIWKFPVENSPVENTRNAVQVTRQTGQVQTPSLSPDGSAFGISRTTAVTGTCGVAQADGTRARQITFETDPTNHHRCSKVVSGRRSDCVHHPTRNNATVGGSAGRTRSAQDRRSRHGGVLVQRWTLALLHARSRRSRI